MPTYRIGIGSELNLKDRKVGVGSETPVAELDVSGTLKHKNSIATGIATFARYTGFAPSALDIKTSRSLTGENQIISDIVVGIGKTFTVSVGSTLNISSLDSVVVTDHFSPPVGGVEDRPEVPVEGTVRFNKDLNTLEFYNGVEWRQFTVSGQSGRGLFAGGRTPSFSATIGFINISSLGNCEYFGQLQTTRESISCNTSSSTRGLFAGGYGPATVDTIGYVSIASSGNAADFVNLAAATYSSSGGGSSTRGIFGGGFTSPTQTNVIQYVEIATIGNALDFGDLTVARRYPGSASSPIRCVFGGGADTSNPVGGFSTLDYIQIASKGDAKDFGNLSQITWFGQGSCSSSTRGLFHTCANSWAPGWATSINVDSIEISSTGNGTGFGDLTLTRSYTGGVSNSVRACFGGGFHGPSTVRYNTIDYISISSGGNATDFGNLIESRTAPGTCSDSHGGLGGY